MSTTNDQFFYNKMSPERLQYMRAVVVNQLETNFDEFFLTHGGENQKAKHNETFQQMLVYIDEAIALKEKP